MPIRRQSGDIVAGERYVENWRRGTRREEGGEEDWRCEVKQLVFFVRRQAQSGSSGACIDDTNTRRMDGEFVSHHHRNHLHHPTAVSEDGGGGGGDGVRYLLFSG